MKNLFTILATIMCISCSNNNDNDKLPEQGIVIGASIDISLKNSEGNYALGNDKYPTNEIYAEYLIKGKIIKDVSNGSIPDNPNNVHILNQNEIRIFLNLSDSEEYPITYIHWNETDTDTIKAQYNRTENSTTLKKVWLFKNKSWEELNSGVITIVK